MTGPIAGSEDRAPEVEAMFDQLAPKYDRANRVLSLGLDQRWRRVAIDALGDAEVVLDLCAGTLDLSRMLIDRGTRQVIAVDFSAEMLAVGQQKFAEHEPIRTVRADARALPLDDASVDGIVCGFGLRNVPELHRAIAECARVLRPGGRLVVLDFFRPTSAVSRLLQGSYNRFLVPVAGGALTGFRAAYRYLQLSIDAFHSADEFVALLGEHGMTGTHRAMVPPVAQLVEAVRDGGSHD
jgi:demethylmenaquinone methyltransferase/2-methoxy-6-polyprenyl-1,4-benzoquinol methylase